MSGWLALAANALLLGFMGFTAWLEATHPGAYYAAAQEDQALEWASFWSFFVAGVVFAVAARRQRKSARALPWFLAGLALFCLFVAMEEISWGQRVFGQRPPEYFLSENYQQELNLHNIAGGDLRLFVFRGIILGYGVLLPLAALVPAVGRLLDRLRIVAPPIELSPAMFAIYYLHLHYPWKFTGEIAECLLGYGFLFSAMVAAASFSSDWRPSIARSAVIPIVVTLLGFGTAAWSQSRQADPATLARARAEVAALAEDMATLARARGVDAVTKCNLHKRVYTFVRTRKLSRPLSTGSFAGMVSEGMPEARAEYFLDPWNNPYWIRDRCREEGEGRTTFVYSFGPNRSRDSTRWEVLDDDVGAPIVVHEVP